MGQISNEAFFFGFGLTLGLVVGAWGFFLLTLVAR